MKMRKNPSDQPTSAKKGNSVEDFCSDYALAAFIDNHQDGVELLFKQLAKRIRNGTIQDHPGLQEYLASACDAISKGADPKKALGMARKGKKKENKTHSQGLLVALNVRHAVLLWPEKPIAEIFEIVSSAGEKKGVFVSRPTVELYYYEHLDGIKRIEAINPNSKLWWRPDIGTEDTFIMPITK